MTGALPSQRDGGLAAGTARWLCLWEGVSGGAEASGAAGGQSGPECRHRSPGQTQKPAKGLVPLQHPKSFPPRSKLQGKGNAVHA